MGERGLAGLGIELCGGRGGGGRGCHFFEGVEGGRWKEEGGRRRRKEKGGRRKEEGGRAEGSGAEIVNLEIRDFPVAVLRRAILTRAQAGEGGFTRYPCN